MSEHPTALVQGEEERDRVLGKRSPKAIHWEVARIHHCATCGKDGPWDKGWAWYGRLLDLDEGRPVLKFCSRPCRAAFEVAKKAEKDRDLPWRERIDWHIYEAEADIAERWSALREAGDATKHRKVPMPEVKPGTGKCRWCAEQIFHDRGPKKGQPANGRSWHTPCYHLYELHTSSKAQFNFLFDRDGPKCQICGGGKYALALESLYHPPGMDWKEWWKLHQDPDAPGRICYLKPSIRLEVDHIVPLWRAEDFALAIRRQLYGPKNLWLLCTDCHKAKSAIEAAERAARKRGQAS